MKKEADRSQARLGGVCMPYTGNWVSLMAQMVKTPCIMQETWVQSLVSKIPWRREWLPTSVFLPEEFYGQRSLAGYIVHGVAKESDMTY